MRENGGGVEKSLRSIPEVTLGSGREGILGGGGGNISSGP